MRERARRVNGRREDNGVEMVKSVCVLSLTILLSSLYDFTNRSQAMAELLYAKVAERRNDIAICCTGMGRYFLFTFQIIFYRTRGVLFSYSKIYCLFTVIKIDLCRLLISSSR
jgi:hypothetical protein